jgi:hypothetical protein
MSRCPYCRRELPGFETLCQKCFEKGYEQIAHPKPWWQRHRLRLTHRSFFSFLFVFVYAYIVLAINRENRPTITSLVFLALIFAAGVILISTTITDSTEPKVPRRGAVYGFLMLFIYFFFRLWAYSSYHPIKSSALYALICASIAAIVESTRGAPDTGSAQKKAPEAPAPIQYDSRDAVKREGKTNLV